MDDEAEGAKHAGDDVSTEAALEEQVRRDSQLLAPNGESCALLQ